MLCLFYTYSSLLVVIQAVLLVGGGWNDEDDDNDDASSSPAIELPFYILYITCIHMHNVFQRI